MTNIKKDPTILRGEVYTAELPERVGSVQGGFRPVVVIQNNIGNNYSPTVIVVPVTSRTKKIQPTHFSINLEKDSVVLCEQIQTIPMSYLKKRVYYLSGEEIDMLDQTLRMSVGLQ